MELTCCFLEISDLFSSKKNLFCFARIEKQRLIEIKNTEEPSEIRENTRNILEKIDGVNRKHGLVVPRVEEKESLPSQYSRFQDSDNHRGRNYNFMFPQNPLTNPIFEYLQKANLNDDSKMVVKSVREDGGAAAADKDLLPGQFIKRKVTHHQTVIIPSYPSSPYEAYPAGDPNLAYQQGMYQQQPPFLPPGYMQPQFEQRETNENQTKDLEKKTIDNIKNIVTNSQALPKTTSSNIFNPSFPQPYFYQPMLPGYYNDRPSRQFQPPFQNVFPIVIKNPFQAMFNAFTSMVEYGQEADVCSGRQDKPKPREGKMLREKQSTEDDQEKNLAKIAEFLKNINLNQNESSGDQDAISIENLELSSEDNALEISMSIPSDRREKQISSKKRKTQNKPSKDDYEDVDDLQIGSEKGVFTSDNNKRQVYRNNAGSGIFIQKLKVSKGGVAIAGPGGIATAGSGGTAIVGPNGYAYTQPDSLAIAGSGAKVIAVDPSINLGEVIIADNKTKKDGFVPRIGKIVAVGPVVYYNKG